MWLMSDQISQQINQLSSLMEKIYKSWANQNQAAFNIKLLNEDVIKACQKYNLAYISILKSAYNNPTNEMLLNIWLRQLQMMNPELVLRPILNHLEQIKPRNETLNSADVSVISQEARRLFEEGQKAIQTIMNYQFDHLEKMGIDPDLINLTKKHIETIIQLTQTQYQSYAQTLGSLDEEYEKLMQMQSKPNNYNELLNSIREGTQIIGRQYENMLNGINEFLHMKIPSASVVIDAINANIAAQQKRSQT